MRQSGSILAIEEGITLLLLLPPYRTDMYTDKKENKIFLKYKEIESGAVA
jgi:hypothetical protein